MPGRFLYGPALTSFIMSSCYHLKTNSIIEIFDLYGPQIVVTFMQM
jgi:hypothetical protein